jgi:diphthamide biosynthesis protein 7
LHFHPTQKNIFAIASSVGSVALFQLSIDSTGDASTTDPNMTELWTKQVHEDSSIPALFLAWAPQNWFPRSPADGFAVTFSDSRTAVFGTQGDLRKEESVVEWGTYEAKQMIEVWFVALASMAGSSPAAGQKPIESPFMFTGNDFGSLHTRRFDNTAELDDPDESISPMLLEHDDRARHHTAGVTAILPLPVPLVDDAPILLTGSYDEGLRVYHASRRGEVLAEENLEGGVWRLQLLDTTKITDSEDCFLVLASCMHAGTRVVGVKCKQQDGSSEWEIEVLAKFTEHESMNYASGVWNGAKASEKADQSSELLVVSSSFYDRRLCVWTATV